MSHAVFTGRPAIGAEWALKYKSHNVSAFLYPVFAISPRQAASTYQSSWSDHNQQLSQANLHVLRDGLGALSLNTEPAGPSNCLVGVPLGLQSSLHRIDRSMIVYEKQ